MERCRDFVGAYNWIKLDNMCPVCGRESAIVCQTHAAASFDGDQTGRFHERAYRLGERMAWWPPDDPRFGSWRVNGRRDGKYVAPGVDEEACYAKCGASGHELYAVIRYRNLVPEAVLDVGAIADWPGEYFD